MKKLIVFVIVIVLISLLILPEITSIFASMGMEDENKDKKWAEKAGFIACQTNIRYLRYGSAIDLCKDYLKTYPDSDNRASVYYYLALAYENEDETENAINTYKLFEKKYPNHMWAEQAQARRKKIEALNDIDY